MELPRPVRQEASSSSSEFAPPRRSLEKDSFSAEGKSSGSVFNPPIPVVQSDNKTNKTSTLTTKDSGLTTQTSGNPVLADDVDVIEKEWVQKAKQIVEKTKQDPYQQNKEMNVFKADYMKKRYGKDLKLTGE